MSEDDKLQKWIGYPRAQDVDADGLYEFLWVGSFHPPLFARVYRAGDEVVALGCRGKMPDKGKGSEFERLEAHWSRRGHMDDRWDSWWPV